MDTKDETKVAAGHARADALTPERRSEIAKQGATARWGRNRKRTDAPTADGKPLAIYKGVLELGGADIPCYVLNSGERVIGRTAFTETLTDIKGGGDLEKYLGVSSLKPFINIDLVLERMVAF